MDQRNNRASTLSRYHILGKYKPFSLFPAFLGTGRPGLVFNSTEWPTHSLPPPGSGCLQFLANSRLVQRRSSEYTVPVHG